MVMCLYGEGNCWTGIEMEEFSVICVAAELERELVDPFGELQPDDTVLFKYVDGVGAEMVTVQHLPSVGMTVITTFNSDGEGSTWIAPTFTYV